MALADLGLLMPFPTIGAAFSTSPTTRSIAAATHWVGGQFIAPVTDTITEIRFRTGTVTSPVFQLEGAITALDANGYPLGADVAVSSTTITNPAASTNYTLTISASVTAGNWYGIIVRVKSGTYTSGSANVAQFALLDWLGANGPVYPGSSYNLGANTKTGGVTVLMPKYSSAGWVATPGLYPYSTVQTESLFAANDVLANKFTLSHTVKVWGFLFYIENDDDNCVMGLFAGSDTTPMTGGYTTLKTNYRANFAASIEMDMLAAPLILNPGTYRVGLKSSGVGQTTTRSLAVPAAGMQAMIGPGMVANMMYSEYTTSWTDTDTRIAAIMPIISAVDDGRPWATYAAGIG